MFNKTVLVVERNPDEAARILDFFKSHNFRNKIEIVQNKGEALDYIFGTGKYAGCEEPVTPGLILLDLETNRTREVKILKPLQSYLRTHDIPIIILTRSEEQEAEIAASGLGIIGLIRTPLEFTHFVEVIQNLGMRWRGESKSKCAE